MNFENTNFSREDEKNPAAASAPEEFKKDIELSPAMQAMYEEIVAEKSDEDHLESEARKMSAIERFGVLGKAIERAGKLARRIAVVAFAAFSPSLAGGADTVKQVEKDLINATQTEWQNVKTEKLSPKEQRLKQEREKAEEEKRVEMEAAQEAAAMSGAFSGSDAASAGEIDKNVSEREKESREISAIVNNAPSALTNYRTILMEEDSKTVKAYRAGKFKTHEEYLKWKSDEFLAMIKNNPELVKELSENIEKFSNPETKQDFIGHLMIKYKMKVADVSGIGHHIERQNQGKN